MATAPVPAFDLQGWLDTARREDVALYHLTQLTIAMQPIRGGQWQGTIDAEKPFAVVNLRTRTRPACSSGRTGLTVNAPFHRPYGCPLGIDPAEWRQSIAVRIEQLQDAIQAYIAALDMMDGDPDLEPSIVGGVAMRDGERSYVDDDREGGDVNDEGEPNDWDAEESGDDEHPLGWGFGEEFVQGLGSLADCTDLEENASSGG